MAAALVILTLAMGGGIVGATMGMWTPRIKKAFDPRKSIASALASTIASRGIYAAVEQYQDLKTSQPETYNFAEDELDVLGYQMIRQKKYAEAVRIFQLNVAAYPQSSNVYDSLGEAYMDDSNKPQAIANYQKSLQLNPKNRGAVVMLQKLNAP